MIALRDMIAGSFGPDPLFGSVLVTALIVVLCAAAFYMFLGKRD